MEEELETRQRRFKVRPLTVGHAAAAVRAVVALQQLSVDGRFHQFKLQLVWRRVCVAHRQLLTTYTHGQEAE